MDPRVLCILCEKFYRKIHVCVCMSSICFKKMEENLATGWKFFYTVFGKTIRFGNSMVYYNYIEIVKTLLFDL